MPAKSKRASGSPDATADALREHAVAPHIADSVSSVWAQYTLRVQGSRRDAIADALKRHGVPTVIYYPKPLHLQEAYKRFPVAGNGLPTSEKLALEVLSLPMHPYLDERTQDYIIAKVIETLA